MSNKKAEILLQLEQGKITANEAFTMLNELSEHAHTPQQHTEPEYRGNGPQKNQPPPQSHYTQPDWVESLIGDVTGAVQDALDGIREMNIGTSISEFMSGTYGHYKNTLTFTSDPVLQGISQLVIIGKNARVSVSGYSGNVIRVKCIYDARHPDAEVLFHEENGIYQVMYDESVMRSMEITCEVPHVMIKNVHVASKNATVALEDVQAEEVALYTKNAKILANNISCTEFIAQSKNDAIRVQTLVAQNIHMETTNAKIQTEDVRANNAKLKTTNDRIKMELMDVEHLKIDTTNAGLKLDKHMLGIDDWHGERTFEAHTTNSGISFSVPSDVGIKVQAHARGGKIVCKKDDMYFVESNKYYAQGESGNYAICGKKLNVRLSTTNASVKIKEVEPV